MSEGKNYQLIITNETGEGEERSYTEEKIDVVLLPASGAVRSALLDLDGQMPKDPNEDLKAEVIKKYLTADDCNDPERELLATAAAFKKAVLDGMITREQYRELQGKPASYTNELNLNIINKFRALLKKRSYPTTIQNLLELPATSEFWQSQDITMMTEVLVSFRQNNRC